MSLTYVGIRVTDRERSVRFYVEGLGLVEQRRGTMGHGGQWASLRDPESQVEPELNSYPPRIEVRRVVLPGRRTRPSGL